ncbi:MAG: NUDIX domain-containing protein [Alphaproteobacteria bacterium]|nr:NUDIX domain-containing protein [Alphaproteobacteria bacterium]
MAENNIAIVEHAVVFQGHFRVERYGLRFRRFDGGMSRVISREVFERGHAAAVLPFDPVRDEVVLLEQFRVGALNAPGRPWCLEPVAGIIEEGERAEDVARRETQEEAGLELLALLPICEYLASPGGSSERIALFLGRIDATKAGGVHGLADEGEDIRSLVLPFDAAWREMMGRPVAVASLLIAMQWLALNRDAVRRQWQA